MWWRRRHVWRCKSPKCAYVWMQDGRHWYGPYWPWGTVCEQWGADGGCHKIQLSFGDYCDEVVRKRTKREIKEMYSDCWPLEKLS